MTVSNQVWNWNTIQRSHDSLMNKAYIFACRRLIEEGLRRNKGCEVLDIGCGSGLVLRHLNAVWPNFNKYFGLDINRDGILKLENRANNLSINHKVSGSVQDASIFNQEFENRFDQIFSNFCFYTIQDKERRISALNNVRLYSRSKATFHIALPSENYSAFLIAKQCIFDELNDRDQNLFLKILRGIALVPYQYEFVLKPIEKKVNEGLFLRFNQKTIEKEFKEAGLKIDTIQSDYGTCAYHIHGKI